MSRWFRFYDGVLDDPKVQRLPKDVAWGWVNMLCLASRNGGVLPSMPDIAFALRLTDREAESLVSALLMAGLLDDVGGHMEPHNWRGRQFKADSSNDRVKRHREKREKMGLVRQWVASKPLRAAVFERDGHACVYCASTEDLTLDHKTPEARGGANVIENLQVACRICNAQKRDLTHDEFVARNGGVTVTERYGNAPRTEQSRAEDREENLPPPPPALKKTKPRAAPAECDPEGFAQFWAAYPRKNGGRKAAAKAYAKALKEGAAPTMLTGRALAFSDVCRRERREPRFIPMATTWLNQGRWDDEDLRPKAGGLGLRAMRI